MTQGHLLSVAWRALLLAIVIGVVGCAPQVIYVPYPAPHDSVPPALATTPTPRAQNPASKENDEPLVLARFQLVPDEEAANVLRSFGYDPESSLLFIHQLGSAKPRDFGPLAVMSFTEADATWLEVVEFTRQYGDEAATTALTEYMSSSLFDADNSSYVGVSDVTLLKPYRSFSFHASFDANGTVFNQIFVRTWQKGRTKQVIDTQFIMANHRQSLYEDDMIDFIKAVIDWTDSKE